MVSVFCHKILENLKISKKNEFSCIFQFYQIHRYLRVDDCNQIKKTDREAERDEIFLYTGSGIPKNIDAETILWKCSVYDFEHRQSSTKIMNFQNVE